MPRCECGLFLETSAALSSHRLGTRHQQLMEEEEVKDDGKLEVASATARAISRRSKALNRWAEPRSTISWHPGSRGSAGKVANRWWVNPEFKRAYDALAHLRRKWDELERMAHLPPAERTRTIEALEVAHALKEAK